MGVPMVCLPVTNDQPAVAARVAWTGSGRVVPLKQLSKERLSEAVTTVLNQHSFLERAARTPIGDNSGGRIEPGCGHCGIRRAYRATCYCSAWELP